MQRPSSCTLVESTVEVDGCGDECEVSEGLREVAEVLAALADLLAEQTQVIGVPEHLQSAHTNKRRRDISMGVGGCVMEAECAVTAVTCSNMRRPFSRYSFLNMPSLAAASHAQKVQMEKVPSSPTSPSLVVSTLYLNTRLLLTRPSSATDARMASSVLTKRGSVGDMKKTSGMMSTDASSVSLP